MNLVILTIRCLALWALFCAFLQVAGDQLWHSPIEALWGDKFAYSAACAGLIFWIWELANKIHGQLFGKPEEGP